MKERDIFIEALQKQGRRARSEYLDTACRDDDQFRQRVEALLAEHDKPGEFILDVPPEGLDLAADLPSDVDELGARIGPYEVVRVIGRGGMGVVYLARQTEPVERLVALKIIRPGMDTRQVISRFAAERQALATMDHPHIAKVFDAGTTAGGGPYFVMELVQGPSVTEYCDQSKLPLRERLELFISICAAVRHAHQKGIIHHDIKPSNILVTRHDDRAIAKVIDFGVAKAIHPQPHEGTLLKEGTQIIGTPTYMSPEQAQPGGHHVDTQSDVYSLGVLLYELLTGATPFDKRRLHAAGHSEMCRIIREEAPPRPSVRVATMEAATLAGVAGDRSLAPRRLGRALCGDLDWIVNRALQKNPVRRYESVGALAADVKRFLDNELVEACPPSAAYRLRKFVRRNKLLSLAAGGLVCFLLISAVGLGIGNVLISREQAEVLRQRSIARDQEIKVRDGESFVRRYLYAADMQLAWQAYDKADVAEARDKLLRHLPSAEMADNRGFEWHYLWGLCEDAPRTLRVHEADVFHTCASPDGRLLASASSDRTVVVWDIAQGKKLATLRDFTRDVNSTAFSADGNLLATAEEASLARVWDWQTGREIARFSGFAQPVARVFFTPDQQALVATEVHWGSKASLRTTVWDLTTHELRNSLDGYRTLAIHPERQLLAAGNAAGELSLWSLPELERKSVWQGHQAKIVCGAFTPDGRRLATGCDGGKVNFWDLNDLSMRNVSRDNSSSIRSLACSGDGRFLVAATDTGTTRIWDVKSGTSQKVMQSAHGRFWSVEFLPSQATLVTGCGDGTILLHDLPTMTLEKRRIFESPGLLYDVAMDPQAGRLAVIDSDWTTFLTLNVEDGGQRHRHSNPNGKEISAVAFAANGQSVWFGDIGGTVHRCDITSGTVRESFELSAGGIYQLMVSPTGRWLASGSKVKDTWSDNGLLDLNSEVKSSQLGNEAFVRWGSLAEQTLFFIRPGGKVFAWDLQACRKLPQQFECGGYVSGVAVSHDGKSLATGTSGKAIQLWDVATARKQATLLGHREAPDRMVFSADGRTLASASRIGEIKLWNVSTGQPLFDLAGHSGKVFFLAFSPDRRRLVSGGNGADGSGEILVWGVSASDSP